MPGFMARWVERSVHDAYLHDQRQQKPRPRGPDRDRNCSTLENMTEVGIRALKQNASAVVAEAVAGESITITDHGRPVARLTRIPSSPVEELIATGAFRQARKHTSELAEPLPGPDLSSELSSMRESERF